MQWMKTSGFHKVYITVRTGTYHYDSRTPPQKGWVRGLSPVGCQWPVEMYVDGIVFTVEQFPTGLTPEDTHMIDGVVHLRGLELLEREDLRHAQPLMFSRDFRTDRRSNLTSRETE